jgi:PKD repeat protein
MDIATDLSVDASIAQTIRETTKAVVYDSLWKYSCHTFLASQPTADSSEWQFSCLSATEPEVCRWDFGDGSSSTELNVSHTYSASGTYMVQLIAGKSCHTDTYTVEITIGQSGDEPLGIETVDNNKAVSIYPNPAAESIVVSATEPVVLKIVDMKGRVVKQTELSGNQKLSVAELPEGVYVAITADGAGLKTQSQKLIIKHR